MRRPSRIIALLVLAALALGAASYAAFWYTAAEKVRAEIARWADARRADGWLVEMQDPEVAGFPLTIDVLIAGGRLAGPEAVDRWVWELPVIHATATPWRPTHVHVSAPGRHRVTARKDVVTLDAAALSADVVADTRTIRVGDIGAEGVVVGLPDGGEMSARMLRLRLAQGLEQDNASVVTPAAARDSGSVTGLRVAVTAEDVRLPEKWEPPLGPDVRKFHLNAVMDGTMNPRGALVEALTQWRDAGGAVDVRALSIDWQALKLRATGTFALDEALQPQGAATAEIEGVDKTADALIAAGVIDARAAFAAKIANQALTLGGGPARLPLTIQQQKLYLGPVPLLSLKKIVWN